MQDELCEEAIDLIRQRDVVGVSTLQRAFGIGFGRASRILQELEEEGFIRPTKEPGGGYVPVTPAPTARKTETKKNEKENMKEKKECMDARMKEELAEAKDFIRQHGEARVAQLQWILRSDSNRVTAVLKKLEEDGFIAKKKDDDGYVLITSDATMAKFDPAKREEVKDYVLQKGKVTLPEVQMRFGLSFREVRFILDRMVFDDLVARGRGFEYFSVVDADEPAENAKPAKKTKKAKPEESPERVEIREDDEDDEDDEESPALKTIRQRIDRGFQKLDAMKHYEKLTANLGVFFPIEGDSNDFAYFDLLRAYPDGTHYRIYIKKNESSCYLTDDGRTLKFLDSLPHGANVRAERKFDRILKKYGITKRQGELVLRLKEKEEGLETLFMFIAAIEQLCDENDD